ncbi:MAG: fatty acid desaturase [Phycisphaerales bacterium]|jgi:fatty acid desaturase|nr:fatty acid desaturase [Phycisphaerales bacterium]
MSTDAKSGPQTAERHHPPRISWYRCPVPREQLSKLNRRSDIKGLAQSLGYLLTLAATGFAAYAAVGRLNWVFVAMLLFLHGTCYAFLINGVHELVHDSVFKTRWPNRFFLAIFSFLGWHNPVWFWASHTEHHKYTLHQPDDLEVVLPTKLSLWNFIQGGFVNVSGFYFTLRNTFAAALGIRLSRWDKHLFPDRNSPNRRRWSSWAMILLLGHGLIIGLSIYFGLWMLPVVTSLAPFYGGAIQFLCNNTQHIGLKDSVPDYRLCCRTIYLNPLLQFLYWHMNYHTEHHMYAAVPCYNLGKLHRLIKSDMPRCSRGLVQTWLEIGRILQRQKVDETYQYAPPLPASGD